VNSPSPLSTLDERPRRVGIIGGGQLGLMLAESLAHHHALVSILDPDPCAPAARAASPKATGSNTGFVCAHFDDLGALDAFVAAQDVVTYEWESINCEALRLAAARHGTVVLPDVSLLETTRSRLAERQWVQSLALPEKTSCVPFRLASNVAQAQDGKQALGLPLVIKTDRGGYDGKGQWVVTHEAGWNDALGALEPLFGSGARVVMERRLDLLAEMSCVVARSPQGSLTFPIFENTHRNQILHTTDLPCGLDDSMMSLARSVALKCAESAQLHGLLTVEFFYGRESESSQGKLYINEFAPRPHNSGHITRRATSTSQFDILARCLLDLPLAQPQLLPAPPGKRYRMINILGDDMLDAGGRVAFEQAIHQQWQSDLLEYYDYGKAEIRKGRKMGHFIVLTP
jgi:5-(carboxyamino)imidazole ribonucleotide synthase